VISLFLDLGLGGFRDRVRGRICRQRGFHDKLLG